ncbi:MAG: RsmG family class I SAM-dependent methyltransferase [Acidimicrobiia bacterium]
MTELEPLLATLREGQRIGAIGPLVIEEAVAHAGHFVDAIATEARSIIDLGSGGGLPGLVIAWCRPELRLTMVDRRAKRTDFLARAVRRLGLDARAVVINGDVRALGRSGVHAGVYDAVTARSFGPPDETLRLALPFVGSGGQILVSDPPGSDRWRHVLTAELGEQVEVASTGERLTVLRRR